MAGSKAHRQLIYPMKHAFTVIAAYCALLTFNGCSKVKGERIEFGHTYECGKLRGKVYHITFDEDARQIKALKDEVSRNGCTRHTLRAFESYLVNNDPNSNMKSIHKASDCEGLCQPHVYCDRLHKALEQYSEGFLGWF